MFSRLARRKKCQEVVLLVTWLFLQGDSVLVILWKDNNPYRSVDPWVGRGSLQAPVAFFLLAIYRDTFGCN